MKSTTMVIATMRPACRHCCEVAIAEQYVSKLQDLTVQRRWLVLKLGLNQTGGWRVEGDHQAAEMSRRR
jgi:hypothetical protein